MEIIKYVKVLESKFRILLICFCAYSFLFSLVKTSLLKHIIQLENNSYSNFTYLIMIVLAILIGNFVKYELNEFFSEDWDWTPKNKVEEIQNEFFCLVGIGVLYYFTQVGAMVLFFPSFETIVIYGVKLYNILFAVSSVLIYLLYRITIIKFK